jgi:hypothetical protein
MTEIMQVIKPNTSSTYLGYLSIRFIRKKVIIIDNSKYDELNKDAV